MKIGKLQLHHVLVMAPMSGVSDYPFRRLVQGMGCGLVFTEMISAEGVLRKGESLVCVRQDEHPIAVQLFGSDPDVLARAAGMAEGMGADAVDINMGCPAKQVVEAAAGAELMRSPARVKKILTALRREMKGPLTIKIRSGWDGGQINAVEISKIAEGCGVNAISIHGRTKAQGFRGRADWQMIGEVKKAVAIPVIGNGDVTTVGLARRMLEETGCDGVMIGRGALGNPWIFDPRRFEEADGSRTIDLSPVERERVIWRHFSLLQEHYGDAKALREIRRHLVWYTRGIPFGTAFRGNLAKMREQEALFDAVHTFFGHLGGREQCRL
jgi:tRNA-dihydrouridine synthase B